jgi:hypothetical protein
VAKTSTATPEKEGAEAEVELVAEVVAEEELVADDVAVDKVAHEGCVLNGVVARQEQALETRDDGYCET